MIRLHPKVSTTPRPAKKMSSMHAKTAVGETAQDEVISLKAVIKGFTRGAPPIRGLACGFMSLC